MSKARDIARAGTALANVDATELGYLDGVTSSVQTQLDAKAIPANVVNKSIVDAKGDLIVGTAADEVNRLAVGSANQVLTVDSSTSTGLKWATPSSSPLTTKGDIYTRTSSADARQAVGADYGFLQALASETNGIKWNDGAWTTYTPGFTASSGSYTTTTVAGRYIRVGKFCAVTVDLQINNIGTATGVPKFTLPFTQVNAGSIAYGVGRETAYTGLFLHVRSTSNSNECNIYLFDGNTGLTGAQSGWRFGCSIVFEVA